MGACAIATDANISIGLESNTTGITSFSMPGWQLALWATAYLALVLVAVTGNATVIWIDPAWWPPSPSSQTQALISGTMEGTGLREPQD